MLTFRVVTVLRWLAQQADPTDVHIPENVMAGEDTRTVYYELTSAGLADETVTLGGAFSFHLTPAGWVEARNTVDGYRAELVARRVLQWTQEPRNIEGLIDSAQGNDFTGPLTAAEVDDAIDELEQAGLLTCPHDFDGRRGPLRTTTSGRAALRSPYAVLPGSGLRVEEATFEEWNVGDRRPEVVVFANSWHWVDHTTALPNIRDMLVAGGHLVLVSHALRPVGAIAERIDDVYRHQQLPDAQPAPTPPNTDYLTAAGFTVTADTHLTETAWPTQAWLNQQFTISTHLLLTPQRAHRLRRALTNAIGGTNVPLTEHTCIVTASV